MALRKDIFQAAVVLCAQALQTEICNNFIMKQKGRRKRRIWVQKWIDKRLGVSDNLFKELALEDPIAYRKVLQLTCEKFVTMRPENALFQITTLNARAPKTTDGGRSSPIGVADHAM